jgi:hypothetical protein
MSNSPLVSYVALSPNHSGQRSHCICKITPHYVAGNCTVETLGEVFQQATRYNAVVQARYIILSNGLLHYCYESTPTGYVALHAFPMLG